VEACARWLELKAGASENSGSDRVQIACYVARKEAAALRTALAATPPEPEPVPDTDTPCLTCKHGDTDACYDPCYGCCHNHVSAWEPEAKPETAIETTDVVSEGLATAAEVKARRPKRRL